MAGVNSIASGGPLGPGLIGTGYYSASAEGEVLAADVRAPASQSGVAADRAWLYAEHARRVLTEAFVTAPPSWFVDGAALTLSTLRFASDSLEYGRIHPLIARQLRPGQLWPSLRKVIAGELVSGQDYSAGAVLLAHYILSDAAHLEAFNRYLQLIKQGGKPVGSFATAFDIKPERIDDELRRYLASARGTRSTGLRWEIAPATVTSLPTAADDLLVADAALTIGGLQLPGHRNLLALSRRIFARHPADPFAQRVLAKVEILMGQPATADHLLDGLLAKTSNDPELLYWKGMRFLVDGRPDPARRGELFRRARFWLTRAIQSDPTYYPAIYRYVETLQIEPEFVSRKSADLLLHAASLAPHATQIQIAAADMLMLVGRADEAKALLRRVQVTPRDPLSARASQRLDKEVGAAPPSATTITATFAIDATWKDTNCC